MTRERCRVLRYAGFSIGRIARTLRLSESTVHWHVKDIRLTGAQLEKLKGQKRELMAKVNARRRGRPLKPIVFRKPGWTRALVDLVAHLSFDGRIDRYGCYYYNRSLGRARHVKRSLTQLLGVRPRMRLRANGVWVVSFHNVAVGAWLASKERELLHVIRNRPQWQRPWLRALFDDEGHVHVSRGIRRIRASQDDRAVLRCAQRFLRLMHIESRIDLGARAVEITGRDNLLLFRKRINFSPGIWINHHRKNGLWSQPLEKRQLLDLALQSYRN
jgi:hypothetical protein